MLSLSNPTSGNWAVDSAATDHMCNNQKSFTGPLIPKVTTIRLGDHSEIKSLAYGNINLNTNTIIQALYVPQFRISLLSIRQLDKEGWISTFGDGKATLYNPRDNTQIIAPSIDNLYRLKVNDNNEAAALMVSTRSRTKAKTLEIEDKTNEETQTQQTEPQETQQPEAPVRKKGADSLQTWHRRFAHLHSAALKKVIDHTTLKIGKLKLNDPDGPCDVCVRAKHTRKFERRKVPRASAPFELIHSDLCGPLKPSCGGATYYIIYIDDYTRYVEVYFLRSKSAEEIMAKFKIFHAWVKTQGYVIKRFRCDNGRGEFNNTAFTDALGLLGINYEPAPPYTQHMNGTAERMIRTLNAKGRCMMLDAELPMRFWAESIKTACYIHRRTPTSSLPKNISPHEALFGVKPAVHHLKRFGCTVYKHIPKEQREGKFNDRSKACMMLGYVHNTTKIWRIWDFGNGHYKQGRAVECSSAIFNEHENAYARHLKEDKPGNDNPDDYVIDFGENHSESEMSEDEEPEDTEEQNDERKQR
jgi:transposase InsO family protein